MGHPLERFEVLVRMERHGPARRPDREHVLDGHGDPRALLDIGQLVDQPAAERALPPIRRMDDHDGDAGVGRRLDGAVDLPDRVGAPDLPRQEQARRVERADLETELVGERADPRGSWLSGSFVTMTSTPCSRTRRPSGRSTTEAARRRRPRRTGRAGKPSHRCYRLSGGRRCVSCRPCGSSRSPRRSWRSSSQRRSPGNSPGTRRIHLAMWSAALADVRGRLPAVAAGRSPGGAGACSRCTGSRRGAECPAARRR